MKTIFITFILVVIMTQLPSCYPYCIRKNNFTPYCHKEENTGLSNVLNLNGYFSWKKVAKKNIGTFPNIKTILDTTETNCVFYENGIFIYHYYKEHFQKNKPIGYRVGMAMWGSYIVNYDTIKAFVTPVPGTQISCAYIWFKIIDKNTIKVLCYNWSEPITQQDIINYLNYHPDWRISQTLANLIPYDSLPDPNLSWIMKKKWFWCNENDYKRWKAAQKKKR